MMAVRLLVNRLAAILALLWLASMPRGAMAEDGYDLWLRYEPLGDKKSVAVPAGGPIELRAEASPTIAIARAELERGLDAMFDGAAGRGIVLARETHLGPEDGEAHLPTADAAAGAFRIGQLEDGRILIAARSDIGILYGAFALLRDLQIDGVVERGHRTESPSMPLRLLNHWDNPDGHVERGYAGRSIFDWWRLPHRLDRRMIDYARANASVGINGVVVNNVNASPLFLTDRYLPKLVRLADAWRPYGIRLYISARFSAPRDVGGLPTADPLDPQVGAWWKAKADRIYAAIPDFGGFLVKANSEGQPGPQDYGRSHADGANMLAAALGTRGDVIWRAFVYSADDETDRTRQAYAEFVPLDGKFAPNVILQVKNGPLDFQPREPFHPLFGAMPSTRLMLEAQVTREYLGQASGIVYLAPMWEEVLNEDTGRGGTVAQVVSGGGIAGVANTGADRNWTGGHFDQANWYAFGRLAWDPSLSSEAIAREWAAQTFSRDPVFVDRIVPVMLASRATLEDYIAPYGLAHLMGTGHHYGPEPWQCELPRPEWNPCYYHRADSIGIGFDRTPQGSDALSQYAPRVAARWADPATIDEDYLLWFHRVRWGQRMQDGQTLWHRLVARYDRGERAVAEMQSAWAELAPHVDSQRHADVAASLAIQYDEARWWRDASIAYWQSLNGLPLPPGVREPAHSLAWYRAQSFPEAPGQ